MAKHTDPPVPVALEGTGTMGQWEVHRLVPRAGVMAPDYKGMLVKRQARTLRTTWNRRVGSGRAVLLEQSEPGQSNHATMFWPAGPKVKKVAEWDGGQVVAAQPPVMVPDDLGCSGELAYDRSSSAVGVRGDKGPGVHGTGREIPDGPSGVDRVRDGGGGSLTEAEDDAGWS